jgi:hypothetical protein
MGVSEKRVCYKTALKLDATRLVGVSVTSLGLVQKLLCSNIGRTSKILNDVHRVYAHPLEAED